MLRASAACEAAGVPTSSLVCEGFISQAVTIAPGLGVPDIPLALIPGHVGAQSSDELRRNILEVTIDKVIDNLTRTPSASGKNSEPAAREIVFEGDFRSVNRYYYKNGYTDGLPIVPPTRELVQSFLDFTVRDPDEVLAIMPPDSRAATIWSIAVNGVMAGCEPQYMPILIALVEAMGDPRYGVEGSGNTGGGDTLIILNGPIIKQLGFNYTQGVVRDGFLPNTSIGRFWRLYLRNVSGFRLHGNDKSTFGSTWRVLAAENEDVMKKIGWETTSVEMGLSPDDNAVTIARYTGGNPISSVSGSQPSEMLPYLADAVLRQHSWQLLFTVGTLAGSLRPLLLLSPILAETIAKAGLSKADVKQYLFDHARLPAWQFERILHDWTDRPVWNISEEARLGHIPKSFAESDDPNRMVPIVWSANDFMVVVTGDPMRTSAYAFAHNGSNGYPVAKRIQLPQDWDQRIAALEN